ncbi:MAG: methylenetetrahydrofolate reductase C-terminal domain-containing protein, partial [Chloroflexi bacterium]|nr:methylenetetrahydrofolate reductase C-terminal domain-containing protein [Chloroflexota bacterium]
MRFLQNWPWLLEIVYKTTLVSLRPFRPWLKSGGLTERFFVRVERLSKGLIFDCRMCGQCVLHNTGMTCPMTCPKNLRNGPCGGVRTDGNCEVISDMPCVWAQAWERSKRMPTYGQAILQIQPPLNRSLEKSSAWINELNGVAQKV